MSGGALHIDLETRSAVDLTRCGVHRYAEDPTTEIICFSYRFGDNPIQRWYKGTPLPETVLAHIRQGLPIVGHNQGFERAVWNAKVPHAQISIEQQDCTMARAAAMGLPSSLLSLGTALNIEWPKDMDGHHLMMSMCKPKGFDAQGRPLYKEDPESIARLAAYCDRDVEAEVAIDRALPGLSARERRVWELDQHINDRGFRIDAEKAFAAQQIVEEARHAADRRMWEITGGAVQKTSQVMKLVDWLSSRGIQTSTVANENMDDLIVASQMFDDPAAEAALRCRRSSAGAFKFQSMLAAVCCDGRVRGSLAYHGTHGGRWAGRVVQPHNMKRMDTDEDVEMVAIAIEQLGSRRPAHEILTAIDMMAGPPLEVLSMCARPMIVSEPAHELFDADFSNIEGRINAWFAGAEWKLQAFREYDAGRGPDLYKVTAGAVLGKDPGEINKPERQLFGKVPELSGGYQGGVKAIQKAGIKGGLVIPAAQAQRIVGGYRDANPEIVQSWYDLNDAAIEAVKSPGMVVPVLRGKVRYLSDGNFLYCQLPSGRIIHYASPKVEWRTRIFTEDGDQITEAIAEALPLAEQAKLSESTRLSVTYWGVKGGRLMKLDLYGGAQCAHIVSGTARDLLVEAMFAVEDAGYPLILTIHDEVLSERRGGSAAEYEQIILNSKPKWIGDVPIVAKAWQDTRYSK